MNRLKHIKMMFIHACRRAHSREIDRALVKKQLNGN